MLPKCNQLTQWSVHLIFSDGIALLEAGKEAKADSLSQNGFWNNWRDQLFLINVDLQ